MADDKTTRSKLSEKDRKDIEDEELRANISGPKPKDTSKGKSKATTQAHENTEEEEEEEEEEEATKKKLKIGVGDTKGLERKTNKSVHGKGIADSSGVQIKSESEIQSETEMPMKTDEKFELVKAEAESFSEGEEMSLDLTKSDDSNRSVEEFAGKVHGSPGVMVEDYFKLVPDDVGAVTPETGGVISAENQDELKQSEKKSTGFEGLEIEKKSTGLDLEIDTNKEGIEEELARRAKKGKAKLEGEGKELDDYVEVETNVEGLEDETYEVVRPSKIEGLAKEMRELYRQVTKGTKDKVNRLMKFPGESPSEGEEESESESESESERENCEMLLKTSLRLMLELDNEIRGLLEELEHLLMLKVDEAGRKVLALRDEVEVLKESNYAKEVEVIGMVKGLMDGGAAVEVVIDAVWKSEIGPMVEKAKEKIAQVKSEREEVEMDRNKSSDAAEN
ncbi:hypothetical protein RHGRI_005473 [Rhododendron griersonianum]|uniref:Uncharacterized protein n=1 Tax=Rhododendron griersonianum TaxID=479676 RepID=A0AAV6LDE6_9ERIC|nr:hypothetical protein RHGRI_005473 [Rhododendron griersonianum]